MRRGEYSEGWRPRFPGFIGHDEGRLPLGKADDDTAGKVRIDIHGDKGADSGLQGKDEGSRCDNDEIQGKYYVSDFQVIVFLQDSPNHIEAAGIAVVPVQDTHGHPQYHAAGNSGHQGSFTTLYAERNEVRSMNTEHSTVPRMVIRV